MGFAIAQGESQIVQHSMSLALSAAAWSFTIVGEGTGGTRVFAAAVTEESLIDRLVVLEHGIFSQTFGDFDAGLPRLCVIMPYLFPVIHAVFTVRLRWTDPTTSP